MLRVIGCTAGASGTSSPCALLLGLELSPNRTSTDGTGESIKIRFAVAGLGEGRRTRDFSIPHCTDLTLQLADEEEVMTNEGADSEEGDRVLSLENCCHCAAQS